MQILQRCQVVCHHSDLEGRACRGWIELLSKALARIGAQAGRYYSAEFRRSAATGAIVEAGRTHYGVCPFRLANDDPLFRQWYRGATNGCNRIQDRQPFYGGVVVAELPAGTQSLIFGSQDG